MQLTLAPDARGALNALTGSEHLQFLEADSLFP